MSITGCVISSAGQKLWGSGVSPQKRDAVSGPGGPQLQPTRRYRSTLQPESSEKEDREETPFAGASSRASWLYLRCLSDTSALLPPCRSAEALPADKWVCTLSGSPVHTCTHNRHTGPSAPLLGKTAEGSTWCRGRARMVGP